jgi:ketosteroid isomerase-like protein
MAGENIELVKSIYADWERGDFSSSEWADPGIEYVVFEGPGAGTAKGLSGMATSFRDLLRTWEGMRVEAESYRELDDDRVLAFFHFTGRGRRSGLEASQLRTDGVQLFEIRAGKVTRLVQYYNRERGLAHLGLEE